MRVKETDRGSPPHGRREGRRGAGSLHPGGEEWEWLEHGGKAGGGEKERGRRGQIANLTRSVAVGTHCLRVRPS